MNNKDNYEIRISTRKNKKYAARYKDSNEWIHFGDRRYGQYHDSTPLKAYSHLDHLDKKRRELYKQRHEKDRHNVGRAGWLADVYLW